MNTHQALEHLRNGETASANSNLHICMHKIAQDALKITSELNSAYHEPEEIRRIFSKLIGKEVPKSFTLFPPFYSECAKNIFIGENVFINCGCHFQDQGGIYIGDNALIGSYVVMATINHSLSPENRADNHPSPIHIGKNVWIGSGAIILPGVTIGDNTVVGAGSIVTKDLPANVVAVGNPCKILREINEHILSV
ncbi:MAG: sugar O-acetyltransferase [Clostridiales bacterium]|nr:sugar O-acetyltransferase [Clostridiales bacterium]